MDVRDGLRSTIDWFRTQAPSLALGAGAPVAEPALTGSADARAG